MLSSDWTSTTYDYRWKRFYDALKKAHPNVTYIASAVIDGVELPAVDIHDFNNPQFFYNSFSRFVIRRLSTICFLIFNMTGMTAGLGTVPR
jgi:hypothetical protein